MVKYCGEQMDRTFAALADPTRREILQRLSGGDCGLTDLAEPFNMTLPAVMKHVGVLERAGLLTHDKQGRVRRCHLTAEPLREASEWIERYRVFWTHQLDALAAYFENNPSRSAGGKSTVARKKKGRRTHGAG